MDLRHVWRRDVSGRDDRTVTLLSMDPAAARTTEIRDAGLRFFPDDRPGIARQRAGRGFSYRSPSGELIRDTPSLARIRALAIPPAWTDVWICPDARGHLQATGRDARKRKQYRYHPRWRSRRDDDKFARMLSFAHVLPRIRKRCERDLALPGLPRERVLALVVRLLEETLIRVGNDEYARTNRSFGLTTLRDRHATVSGSAIRFRFRGKSGKHHEVGLRDRRLAALVRRCQELPGQELFQYIDDAGEVRDIASDDVNDYLRDIAGADVTAKDFRTWAGTVLAYRALQALALPGDERAARQQVVTAMQATADRLGNTPAVARGSYVHPAVIDAYLDGSIGGALVKAADAVDEAPRKASADEEAAVVRLLRRRSAAARRADEARPTTPRVSGSPARAAAGRARKDAR